MASVSLWPVLGSLGAAGGTAALIWYLRARLGRPGASWLVAVLAVQFVVTASYGVGFLVADRTVRLAVEALFWTGYIWLGALFVAFGLAYTGRGHVIRSPWFGAIAAISLALSVLVVTNPVHGLVWSEFAVVPSNGLWGVTFERRGGAFLVLGVGSLGASVGTLLLVDTILSYGKLYRREAFAVAVSPLPPGLGLVLWTFGLVPAPGINLAPVLFLVHVGFDAYAFVGSGMFEFHPATRRAGNRAAIADLGNPVVIVDERRRVVNVNAAAATTFDLSPQGVLTEPFADCYEGDEVDPTTPEQDVEMVVGGMRRTYKVASTPLSDGTGTHLGYTLVFQDITAERQREQRLAVLNRILRHNLRNDLNVVQLHLDHIAETTGGDLDGSVEPARRNVDDLVALGEKARAFERATDVGVTQTVTAVDVVEAVVADLEPAYPGAEVAVEGDRDATVQTQRALLGVVVSNLVENALEHGRPEAAGTDEDRPTVRVTVDGDDDGVTLTVRDWGPGIPDHELSVLEDGDESALEHGSGLGLWLVSWSLTALGGTLSFDTGADGTTVRVRVPNTASADRSRPVADG